MTVTIIRHLSPTTPIVLPGIDSTYKSKKLAFIKPKIANESKKAGVVGLIGYEPVGDYCK